MGNYVRITDRPVEEVITDLDIAVLSELPDEGSKFGHHTLALQVKPLAEKLGDSTTAQVAARLRVLRKLGFTATKVVYPTNDGAGWQITRSGKEFLEERKLQEREIPELEEHDTMEVPDYGPTT